MMLTIQILHILLALCQ